MSSRSHIGILTTGVREQSAEHNSASARKLFGRRVRPEQTLIMRVCQLERRGDSTGGDSGVGYSPFGRHGASINVFFGRPGTELVQEQQLMRIREAKGTDRESIHSVHSSAFPEAEREIVSKLAVDLLSEDSNLKIVSLVAETEGIVVGHAAFSPVTCNGRGGTVRGYILAPLGVRPEYQKRSIGSQLIESGIQQLSRMSVDILLVYGDPHYYGKFGFSADAAACYVPPYELRYPFGWQGLRLNERGTGKSPVTIACVSCLDDPALW